MSAGPLTSITTTTDLNCAVTRDGDKVGEWFGNTACGTLAVVSGVLYGPASIPAGIAAQTPWTPVSQSAVTGNGTAAAPYTLTTVVQAGTTGIKLTQTDTYVAGSGSYRTDVKLANSRTAAKNVVLYRAGDCFQADSDSGFGRVDAGAAGSAVSCVAPVPFSSPDRAGPRVEQLVPITSGSHYLEGNYSEMWSFLGTLQPLPDTCRCDENLDNAVALSWLVVVPASGNTTVSHSTYFSPPPLVASTQADDDVAVPGSANGYSVTVTNPTASPLTLSSITDLLPDGFTYRAGSTTGVTSANPSISGQQLSWSGSFVVPAAGSSSLHFGVTTPAAEGDYYNIADGTIAAGAADQTVSSSGPAAPIAVYPVSVTAISPAALARGVSNAYVSVTGTTFRAGATIAISGGGVTVDSFTVTSSRSADLNVSVDPAAQLGPRNVTMTNPDGTTGGCTGCFSVDALPAITSIAPSSRGQGAKNQTITVNGSDFGPDASVSVSGAGVTVNSWTVVSSSKITVNVTIAAGASVGSRTLTVTNADYGAASAAFAVNPRPRPTSAAPSVARGTTQTVTITGTSFVPGTGLKVKIAGTGITTSAPTASSATSITVTVTISSTALAGTHKVTVTNPDAGVGTCNCLTLT